MDARKKEKRKSMENFEKQLEQLSVLKNERELAIFYLKEYEQKRLTKKEFIKKMVHHYYTTELFSCFQ